MIIFTCSFLDLCPHRASFVNPCVQTSLLFIRPCNEGIDVKNTYTCFKIFETAAPI